MKIRNIKFMIGIVLIFLCGWMSGIYFSKTMDVLRLIDKTQIENNCMDIRKSLLYLDFLTKNENEKLRESLEWDIDEALLALRQYVQDEENLLKFNEYALNTLAMVRAHREANPRQTKVLITDQNISELLNNSYIPAFKAD